MPHVTALHEIVTKLPSSRINRTQSVNLSLTARRTTRAYSTTRRVVVLRRLAKECGAKPAVERNRHARAAASLKIEDSKNAEPWVLPLSGRLWEIIQQRAKARRLDCHYVFHHDGKKIGDFRKAWQTACVAAGLGSFVTEKKPELGAKKKRKRKKYAGLIVHDLRRCAARNLSRAGVSEEVAMRVTGHKTASMFRRYRIIDEGEIREALEKTQAHLSAARQHENTDKTRTIGE